MTALAARLKDIRQRPADVRDASDRQWLERDQYRSRKEPIRIGRTETSGRQIVKSLRTPDERFDNLPVNYPYLFSLAIRTNPFDRDASPIVA